MKVLVAIDGSEQAGFLIQSLKAFSPGLQILLFHAIHVPHLAYPGTGMTIGHQFLKRAEEAMRTEGSKLLDKCRADLPQEIETVEKRIMVGPPAEVLLALAEEEKVDLVMVGSRGLGLIRERALGSVSHRVTLHSPCPVLVIKAGLERIKNILLPIEHKEDADQAIAFLSKKPFPQESRIILFHVVPFMQPVLPIGALIPESVKNDLYRGADDFLREQVLRVRSVGYPVISELATGAPAQAIREHAQSIEADLIIQGVQRGKRLARFLLGSVSHAVVHHSPCSVLLLK